MVAERLDAGTITHDGGASMDASGCMQQLAA